MEKLTDINSAYGLTERELARVLEIGVSVTLRRGETVLRQGRFNDRIFFIRKGILRTYTFSEGVDKTAWFTLGGEFVTALPCYKLGKFSYASLEAATDAEAVVISKKDFEYWCRSSLVNSETGRKIFEGMMTIYDRRVMEYFEWSKAEDRYIMMLRRHPEILQKIPLQQLATYLDVTPQSLSRIRRGVRT